MAQNEPHFLLREAIRAAQKGDSAAARRMLEQVIGNDPRNELAWIWMATVAESDRERRTCLMRVLEINPSNARARQALDRLEGATGSSRRSTAAQSAPRRTTPRRSLSPLYAVVGILAVAMILVGLFLLNRSLNDEDTPATATPTANVVAVAPAGPTLTPTSMTPSVTPLPTSRLADRTQEPLPPTWTPTATWTPSPTPEPTEIPALDTYTLLVSQQASDGTWNVVTMRADGTNPEPVTFSLPADLAENNTLTWLGAYDASYSPDRLQIAVVGSLRQDAPDGNPDNVLIYQELFTGPAAGGELRQITAMHAELADISWSPDGTQIVFTATAEGDFDVYTIASGGSAPNRLTDNSGADRYPTWSPDGQTITYAAALAGSDSFEIWRMPSVGGEPEQLTEAENGSFAPAYSPDGRWITFISDRSGDEDVYLMNADGTGERVITINDDYDALDPSWSPDSEWIIYSSRLNGDFYQLVAIRPDGTEFQQLTDSDVDLRYAHWTPVS